MSTPLMRPSVNRNLCVDAYEFIGSNTPTLLIVRPTQVNLSSDPDKQTSLFTDLAKKELVIPDLPLIDGYNQEEKLSRFANYNTNKKSDKWLTWSTGWWIHL